MLKDITFGQFFDTGSVLHKADPRTKLLVLVLYIIFIFLAKGFLSVAALAVFIFIAIIFSKIPVTMYLKNVKSILPIIIITALLNVFYSGGGKILVDWWIFTITTSGVSRAVFMALRIVLLILSSAVLSYTTSPTSLTGAIESLLKPLKIIGLGNAVHTMAMVMTIALRFIPTLIEETGKIMNAQKARGADLENGNLIKRVKALIPILIPLLISSIRRAYELAEAMECRCYNGGKGRTKFKNLKFSNIDLILGVITVINLSAVIVLNIFTPNIYSFF